MTQTPSLGQYNNRAEGPILKAVKVFTILTWPLEQCVHSLIFQKWGLFFVWIDKNALYTDYFDKKTREKIHHS